MKNRPSVVLLCHDDDPIDRAGLAAWLAWSMDLAGIVTICETPGRRWKTLRRERKRSGWMGLLDVLALRVVYALTRRGHDRAWCRSEANRLRVLYPAALDAVPRLATDNPNSPEARAFLEDRAPDLLIARCKFLLTRDVFSIPRAGTFVLHPGICPEYRNAHGCFWALANRDLTRVGMTLLRVDAGVDTGPVFLRATYNFNEAAESHTVIQYRVVTENLDAITRTLLGVCSGDAQPLPSQGRTSAVWGQPRLSVYCRWRLAARRNRHAHHLTALP